MNYEARKALWLSVDPIAGWNPIFEIEHYIEGQHNGGVFNHGNLNVYGYTYQNPIIYVDPNGKLTAAIFKGENPYTPNGYFRTIKIDYNMNITETRYKSPGQIAWDIFKGSISP